MDLISVMSAEEDTGKDDIIEDDAPLQKLNDLMSEMELEFNNIISENKAIELKRQEDFQEKQNLQQKKMKVYLEEAKQKIINETLSSIEDKIIEPPLEQLEQKSTLDAFNATVNTTEYEKFAKHPYYMYPAGRNSLYVIVPKFYPSFSVGWLKDEVDGVWNRYEVNQYAVLFGSVPDQILEHLKVPKPIKATVEDNQITFAPEDKKSIKKRLYKHVTDWTDKGARITRGNEYAIIDQILQSGHIPFVPQPVKDEHVIAGNNEIKLRPYQKPVWTNFLKHGAVGVFHPTGSGKSFLGMMALDKIRVKDKVKPDDATNSIKSETRTRRNLIISPKRTLVSQWAKYIEEYIPDALDNTLITTYQGFKAYNEKFGVTIYDECRHLPATTFSRLSTISTEYRMGLDATPYREDGKNHLIVALTGFPQSINWQSYMQKYGPGYHAINVHIVKTERAKIAKAISLYDKRKRTMFYSYHLDIGKKLARLLSLPFITAATDDRLDVMKNNHSFIASSVFVEGVHIEDLESIIENSFHFGSRQEEMQLSGRLMHSKKKHKVHHIIMTYDEFERYRKRLLSLEGNGFHVRLIED